MVVSSHFLFFPKAGDISSLNLLVTGNIYWSFAKVISDQKIKCHT